MIDRVSILWLLLKKLRWKKVRPKDKGGGGQRGPKRQTCSHKGKTFFKISALFVLVLKAPLKLPILFIIVTHISHSHDPQIHKKTKTFRIVAAHGNAYVC